MTDMTTFDRIKELAEKRGKSLPAVSADLEFSDNLFYRWKNSNPKASDLAKVADYFHVSVDYLLGREDESKKSGPIDLTEIANSDDDAVWDKLVSSGGRPLTEKDKAMIRLVFADRWDEITQKAKEIDKNNGK